MPNRPSRPSRLDRHTPGPRAAPGAVLGAAAAGLALGVALGACSAPPDRTPGGRVRAARLTPGDTTGARKVPSEVGGDPRRGAYVATFIGCVDCHTPRAADGVTMITSRAMSGGLPLVGPWGTIASANVTQLIVGMSDPQLKAVIRGHLGSLGPMPVAELNTMATDDMRDLVAYLRTLRPTGGAVVTARIDPKWRGDTTVTRRIPVPTVAPQGPTRARGAYLVTISGCGDCHTPAGADGNPDTRLHLAGGGTPPYVGSSAYRTPNLTPDSATGLGRWTDAQIKAALREGRAADGHRLAPYMPWASAYSAYTDDDLSAVVAYLRSIPAVRHPVPPNPVFHYAAEPTGVAPLTVR